ncbi:MAG: small basic protein [Candidatus Omnitrophota bacterium]
MSQHPSLKSSKTGNKQRTVLKRYERFSALKEKGILKDGASVYGLPKLKILRTKIKKKEAEEKPKEGEAVQAAQTPAKDAPGKQTPAKETKQKS